MACGYRRFPGKEKKFQRKGRKKDPMKMEISSCVTT
jgi:hypothetical protein